jgi:hypothetical protein
MVLRHKPADEFDPQEQHTIVVLLEEHARENLTHASLPSESANSEIELTILSRRE